MTRPKLKYFIQCDEVRNEQGKFSAFGIFDTIYSFIFPATHKRFFLLSGFSGEPGEHDLELHVSGPDGRNLGNTKGHLKLESPESVANVIFEFGSFPLPSEGRYTLSLFMDGDFLAEHFFIAKPPFPRRPRTREEIEALLMQPDVIRSANADVTCSRCGSAYRFQLQLDPEAPVETGFDRLPERDDYQCLKCASMISLAQVRHNLENIVGIPRQWLSPQDRSMHSGSNPHRSSPPGSE